jgi:phage/plasmid-associated DNA primase
MFWIGGGSNGKGLLGHALINLVGKKNVSYLSLKSLSEKFHIEQLHGKLLNFGTESDFKDMDAEIIKSHIHADKEVFADVKNHRGFNFLPTARHVFLSNHELKTSDGSDGFWRGPITIFFGQKFYDPSCEKVPDGAIARDPNAYHRILEELPGILNWALLGLLHLRHKCPPGFSEPDSVKKYKHKMRIANDSIASFIEEKCTVERDPAKVKVGKIYTRTKFLYDAYVDFCNETNSGRKKKSNFITDLSMLFPFIHKQFDNFGNEVFVCVKLNDDVKSESSERDSNQMSF